MTTALLLVALVVTSLGWVAAHAHWRAVEKDWRAAEEEVLRLCTALREAEDRAWAAERLADVERPARLSHVETPAQDSDA